MIDTILKTAAAELGYHEGYNNDNKYGVEYGMNNKPWCVIFLWWCFKHSGAGELFPSTAHCDGVRAHARSIDRWIPAADIGCGIDIRRGDLIILDYDKDNSGDHIAIVEKVNNNNSFVTLEGNYGDAVCRVNRTLEGVSGIYRPDYGENTDTVGGESPSPAEAEDSQNAFLKKGDMGFAVAVLQFALHLNGCTPGNSITTSGGFDGEYGEGTQAALDRCLNMTGAVCTEEIFIKLCKGEKL